MKKVLLRHFSKEEDYRYNMNQSYECLLHDIRGDYDEIREDDIEEMEADFYYECTTSEVLMCCSVYALTELIGTLLVHADNGNELAINHLEEASKELEWLTIEDFLPKAKLYFEEFGVTTLNCQVHNQCVWLKNPSAAAVSLWDSGL
jgi:hypothetical protein